MGSRIRDHVPLRKCRFVENKTRWPPSVVVPSSTLIHGHAPCLSGRSPSSAVHHFGYCNNKHTLFSGRVGNDVSVQAPRARRRKRIYSYLMILYVYRGKQAPSPHANSFVEGTAVINTHTHTHTNAVSPLLLSHPLIVFGLASCWFEFFFLGLFYAVSSGPHEFFTASDDLLTCSKNVAVEVSFAFVVWKELCK